MTDGTAAPSSAPSPALTEARRRVTLRIPWLNALRSQSVSERVSVRVFAAHLVATWFLLMFHWGAGRWFLRDDWVLLAGKDGGDLWSIFEPYGEHMVAVPVVVYRVLYNAFGLRFGPYLAVVVSMHVAVVALLRMVMRRAGVGPWTASICAGVFALFGSGEENILWACQIGFIGSVLFGLVHLVLVDHSGPIGWRDAVGVVFGLLAVGSPGATPLLALAVGLVCLVKRGERVALLHCAVPIATYVCWYVITDPRGQEVYGSPTIATSMNWAREGIWASLLALATNRPGAVILGVIVVAGFAAACVRVGSPAVKLFAIPVTLAGCAVGFYILVAQGRSWLGIDAARSSRYVYMSTALLLPMIAVAADALVRSRRRIGAVAWSVLLIGVPSNIERFDSSPIFNSQYHAHQREIVLGIVDHPLFESTPDWVRFEPSLYNGTSLNVGWLRNAVADGKVPDTGPISLTTASEFGLRLGIAHDDQAAPGWFVFCEESFDPVMLSLVEGDQIRLYSEVFITEMANGIAVSVPVRYMPQDGTGVLVVTVPKIDVMLSSTWGANGFKACKVE